MLQSFQNILKYFVYCSDLRPITMHSEMGQNFEPYSMGFRSNQLAIGLYIENFRSNLNTRFMRHQSNFWIIVKYNC